MEKNKLLLIRLTKDQKIEDVIDHFFYCYKLLKIKMFDDNIKIECINSIDKTFRTDVFLVFDKELTEEELNRWEMFKNGFVMAICIYTQKLRATKKEVDLL
jgi:hypothetical protein